MGQCANENGSFGKGLEKLFRRWGRAEKGQTPAENSVLPDLPLASPSSLSRCPAGTREPFFWDREIRLLALLCLSVALLCLNWISLQSPAGSTSSSPGKGAHSVQTTNHSNQTGKIPTTVR